MVILHDVTSPFHERLSDSDLASLRVFFNMVIATSKWKYEMEDEAQKTHQTLKRIWDKPSKKASFYQFKRSLDAPLILEALLSHVEKGGARMDFSVIFAAMAGNHKKKEAKRNLGWQNFFRFFTSTFRRR